jgi:hypothetical protein
MDAMDDATNELMAAQAVRAALVRRNPKLARREYEAALGRLNDAREARIAVSGRDPERTRRHESAKAAQSAAQSRLKAAREAEDRANQRVRTLAAQHKRDRGREGYNQPIAAYRVGGRRFELRKDAVGFAKANGIPARQIQRVALTIGEARRVGELSQARRAARTARDRRRAAENDVRKTGAAV